MYKKMIVSLCFLALVSPASMAGLSKNSVDLADLSELSAETLETLKDTEFNVFKAQVGLNAAKAAERRAAGGIKAVNRTLEAEDLDMKAAKAEAKAAKANRDEDRETTAAVLIAGAEEDLATAKALRKWKTYEQETRQAEVAMAKSNLDLAEARRDLARLRLLKREATPAVSKYDVADFERNVEKRGKEYAAAQSKAVDKIAKMGELEAEWRRMAKETDLPATE